MHFLLGPSRPKFYSITHLCDLGVSRKFDFFQFSHHEPMYLFLNHDFTLKICSFEIHFVNVAQILREWEGGKYYKFCIFVPPSIKLIFELHYHKIHQQNRFLM